MYFEDEKFKLIAPDVDRLLRCFDRRDFNASASTEILLNAAEPVFRVLEPLAL